MFEIVVVTLALVGGVPLGQPLFESHERVESELKCQDLVMGLNKGNLRNGAKIEKLLDRDGYRAVNQWRESETQYFCRPYVEKTP